MRQKQIFVVAALASTLALTAGAPGNGKGVSCELADGSTYKNPAAMLKALTDRDGHFQNTVEEFSHHFDSVGDLIAQKCSTGG